MNFAELMQVLLDEYVAVISVLVGAVITWFVAQHFAVPPLDIKLKQAKRYKKTGFGEAATTSEPVGLAEKIDSPLGSFTINGNGTVTDHTNSLMWIQARWGMTWVGDKFIGDPIKVDWWDATSLFGKGVILGYPVGTLNAEHLEQSKFEKGYTKGRQAQISMYYSFVVFENVMTSRQKLSRTRKPGA